jgi:hypothetical protein
MSGMNVKRVRYAGESLPVPAFDDLNRMAAFIQLRDQHQRQGF